MKHITRVALAALGAATSLTLVAAPAYAAPSPGASTKAGAGLTAARTLITSRIDGRLETLRALNTAIGGATHLTSAHKSTLQNTISQDTSGLTALKAKVATDTTAAALKADATSMVDDYRVYLLAAPQVHLVIAADLESTAASTLTSAADKLAAAIAKAKAAGKDTTKAEAALADLKTQAAAASAAVSGKADALLALKPSPDGDALKAAIAPVRTDVKTSRSDLKKAAQDAKTIRAAIK